MKPRIWFDKLNNKWKIKYAFYPRQFWMFGATAKEREEIRARCIREIEFDTLDECYRCLNILYKYKKLRLL